MNSSASSFCLIQLGTISNASFRRNRTLFCRSLSTSTSLVSIILQLGQNQLDLSLMAPHLGHAFSALNLRDEPSAVKIDSVPQYSHFICPLSKKPPQLGHWRATMLLILFPSMSLFRQNTCPNLSQSFMDLRLVNDSDKLFFLSYDVTAFKKSFQVQLWLFY